MKKQISPVVAIVAIVALVAVVALVYTRFSAPKGLPKGGSEVVQQGGRQMPQQPFVPTASGGKAEGPAATGGGGPGRPPVVQGGGALIPPGQGGSPIPPGQGGPRPPMGPQGGAPQQPFIPGQ